MTETEMLDLLDRLDGAETRRLKELMQEKERERWSCPRNLRFSYKAKVWERRPA